MPNGISVCLEGCLTHWRKGGEEVSWTAPRWEAASMLGPLNDELMMSPSLLSGAVQLKRGGGAEGEAAEKPDRGDDKKHAE